MSESTFTYEFIYIEKCLKYIEGLCEDDANFKNGKGENEYVRATEFETYKRDLENEVLKTAEIRPDVQTLLKRRLKMKG
jgi:hypothetical protein